MKCERRGEEMHRRGFWLNSWERSDEVPVVLWTGAVVLLTAGGGYLPIEAEAA